MILIVLNRLKSMPKLWNAIKGTLLVFLLLSASIFFVLKSPLVRRLSFNNQTVSVKRNDFGIPHVKAPSFQSAMYAWGYVTAQDRLFQLAFKRLIGKGRLSEHLGSKTLNLDKMFRELNFHYWAEKTAKKLQAQNQTEYENFASYVKGINDHVQSLRFMPIQFSLIGLEWQPWTVADLFLIGKLLIWSQSQNMAEEYIRTSLLTNHTKQEVEDMILFRQSSWNSFMNFVTIVSDEELSLNEKLIGLTAPLNVPEFKPQMVKQMVQIGIMEYLDSGRGSNSWVIAGKHTASGLPLVANDPHLDNAVPNEWHQIRIQYKHKGKWMYWEGGAMTGLPSIIGKTQYVSVALTTIYADTQDLFKEHISDDTYSVDARRLNLKKRVQKIKVKGYDQSLHYQVLETHRGPIINFIGHFGTLYELKKCQRFSLAWSGFHDEYKSFVEYSHSAQINDIGTLKSFLNEYADHGPNMNLVYATADNHIGYTAIGSLPVRRNPESGNYIKDGSKSKHDWISLVQKQAKLSLHDPPKGYIVTANNKPASSKYQNGIYETSMLTARANRIDQMIQQKVKKGEKFTSRDMMNMQLDTIDVICIENLPYLLKNLKQGEQYFRNFNCDFTKTSYQATIYEVFFYQLYKQIEPKSEKGFNLMSSSNYLSYLSRYIRKGDNQTVLYQMKTALTETIANLTSFFNNPKKTAWHWELYHSDIIPHRPFSGSDVLKTFYEKKFGGRGNINTVNVGKMNRLSYGDFTSSHRANIRTILSHSKGVESTKSYWIGDTGVSEKFYSKHYDNQYKLFNRDEYIEIDFEQFDSINNQFQAEKQQEL